MEPPTLADPPLASAASSAIAAGTGSEEASCLRGEGERDAATPRAAEAYVPGLLVGGDADKAGNASPRAVASP